MSSAMMNRMFGLSFAMVSPWCCAVKRAGDFGNAASLTRKKPPSDCARRTKRATSMTKTPSEGRGFVRVNERFLSTFFEDTLGPCSMLPTIFFATSAHPPFLRTARRRGHSNPGFAPRVHAAERATHCRVAPRTHCGDHRSTRTGGGVAGPISIVAKLVSVRRRGYRHRLDACGHGRSLQPDFRLDRTLGHVRI